MADPLFESMPMPRVLIVEDDVEFRDRYAAILSKDSAFEVVASVGTGADGLAMLDLRKPDILLVDLGLPDLSGIEVIRHASRTLPNCESMVVTVFGDEGHVEFECRHPSFDVNRFDVHQFARPDASVVA